MRPRRTAARCTLSCSCSRAIRIAVSAAARLISFSPAPQIQRVPDRPLEVIVRPADAREHDPPGRSVFGNVAGRDRAGPGVPVPHPRHELAQIAHVARIVAREQIFLHRAIERDRLARVVQLRQEVRRQRQDVLGPLAQRRHAADPAGDAVIEIAAEPSVGDARQQIAVGRAHEPELGVLPGVAPDALVLMLLHDPQQLRLQRQRQLADLVEKQRAAVGQREGAVSARSPLP